MICPHCLEDYQFVRFNVDPDTLEHRGEFKCGCEDTQLLPEFMTREIIQDGDLMEQMKFSRMFHLGLSLGQSKKLQAQTCHSAFRLGTSHLQRYLEDVSEKTLRLLK